MPSATEFLDAPPESEQKQSATSFLDEPEATLTRTDRILNEIKKPLRAIGETAKGFVIGLPKSTAETVNFAHEPVETIMKALPGEIATMQTAKTATPFSQEWWNAVVPLAAQEGMAVAGVRSTSPGSSLTERLGLRETPAAEAPADTPLTDAALKTEEVIPSAEKEKNNAPEIQGRQEVLTPQPAAPEPTSPVESAAVSGPESPPAAEPRLLPGETQGDLISSTQPEDLKLVGEKGTDFGARQLESEKAAQDAEEARLKQEHEQGLLADFQQHQEQGGSEFKDALSKAGGLPLVSATDHPYAGELNALREEFSTPSGKKRTGSDYNQILKRNAPDVDRVAQSLRGQGFDVETPSDVFEMAKRSLRGEKIYGSEARGEALSSAGTSYSSLGLTPKEMPDLATRVIKTLQTAADVIQRGLSNKPTASLERPTLNINTGGVRPPPPNSIFAPDTPPGSDPVPIYATRVNNVFARWWQKYWPRDLAVTKVAPDSPVITEHQRILKTQLDYMQKFSDQPWWKALRGRSEQELVELEDRAVKEFRGHLENGVDRTTAFKAVLDKMPDYFRDIVQHREERFKIETDSANELGVEPPKYTGDPYIARLTNEEGKDVVDLNPRLTNLGKQIRSTIGSFDNSRAHATMKDGIAAGTQYEPMARAVWIRELTSIRLEATANLLRSLKENGVLFDDKKAAYDASPNKRISLVRGLGGKDYWARSPEEAVFLEQNISTIPKSPLGKLQQLANTYVRNPSLINPLPHVTKNMAFKYLLARVGNATFKADVAEFAKATPTELKSRFDQVMPFVETGERLPQLTAREVGTWAEKAMTKGAKINSPSSQFIFAKADPAMRFSLWKSYIRKGMPDQEAANHVWLDLIRYDANSGGMNFWKSIPFNFFVPWRTGTYVTLAKQFMAHPVRSLLFIGAVEYMREIRYRKSGRWTHLPVDYLDAPLAEAIQNPKSIPGAAATVAIFGPGGGQAPNTIKEMVDLLHNDPHEKARIQNMFWGISQLYELPREWNAYRRDGNSNHLVNLLTIAAVAEHSAIKYEPRRLMQWLPEWMPGLQKSELVKEAEQLRSKVKEKSEKSASTFQTRHGVSATYEHTPQEQQLEELQRAAGIRGDKKTGGFSIKRTKEKKKPPTDQ